MTGSAVMLPSVAVAKTAPDTVLTSRFGVTDQLVHAYEASSFTGAVGSTISTVFPDLVGSSNLAVNGTITLDSVLSGTDYRTFPTVKYAVGGTSIHNTTTAVPTVGTFLVLAYMNSQNGPVSGIMGRSFRQSSTTGWTWQSLGSTGGPVLSIPHSTVPLNSGGGLVALLCRYSVDGSSDRFLAAGSGGRAEITGTVSKHPTDASIGIGRTGGASPIGPSIAAAAVWSKQLSDAEVNVALTAVSKRWGILIPSS